MKTQKEWVYKNQQKVYINNDTVTQTIRDSMRNEDKAYDYEMEAILAKLHTDNFNEDEYYELKYDRFYHQ
jgi:hypothetical protein